MTLRFGLLLAALVLPLAAQDTRTVVEPTVPPACTTVKARLSAPIAESDETRLDTERLQQAIDACAAGQSVVLDTDGARTAFLSGPLNLRSGVTLAIAKGAILYASRDPRLFDVKPGLCGIVAESGRGCKPLISGERVSNAAVMGEGTIDGRGAEKLLGEKVSWWDLAQQAKVFEQESELPALGRGAQRRELHALQDHA